MGATRWTGVTGRLEHHPKVRLAPIELPAVAAAAAQLAFDEDEGVVFAKNQVDLFVAGAVIALHELVAALQQ